jgi:hypothetical protein
MSQGQSKIFAGSSEILLGPVDFLLGTVRISTGTMKIYIFSLLDVERLEELKNVLGLGRIETANFLLDFGSVVIIGIEGDFKRNKAILAERIVGLLGLSNDFERSGFSGHLVDTGLDSEGKFEMGDKFIVPYGAVAVGAKVKVF